MERLDRARDAFWCGLGLGIMIGIIVALLDLVVR